MNFFLKKITIIFFIYNYGLYYNVKCVNNDHDVSLQNIEKFENESNFLRNTEQYDTRELVYFKCEDSLTNCSGNGVCNNEKDDCICFEYFITRFDEVSDFYSTKPRCNYKLKKQIYALALSLFLSFGQLHFYLDNYVIGYMQFFLFSFIFIFNVTMIVKLSLKHIKKVNTEEYRETLSTTVIICFFVLVFFFWYLFDLFMVIFNIYKDSNGIEMQATKIT